MKKYFALCGMLLLATLLYATSRPIRFEDMFAMGRITSFAVSPDGRWIALAVSTPDIATNKFASNIYLVDSNGASVQKMALGSGNHSHPQFRSNDLLTFVTSKDGESQIWATGLKSAQAPAVLSQIPGGIDAFNWTPDKKKIVFARDVYPDAADLSASLKKEKELENSPVKAKLLTRLPYRIFNQWRVDVRSHVFMHDPETKETSDLTPGDFDTPPVDLGGPLDYRISPDGKWLAYVKNTDPQIAISTNNDIFYKELASGKEINLTQVNPGNDAGPLFSPRNRYLAYLSMKRAMFEADKRDIILYNPTKKTFTNLTTAFANTIQEFVFSPDEKTIYFIAPQSIYQPIFRLDIATHRIEEIVSRIFASSLDISPDGKSLYFLSQSVQKPNEIFRYDLARRQRMQLTRINEPLLQELANAPAETFTFKGAGDEPVEGIMVKPPFFDPQKKYPLVFIVHGGPQGSWGDDFHFRWNMAMFAAPGYVVAGINFHGSTGYGQKFTDSITGDWGGAPFIDLVRGQQYLAEQFPFIDREKIVAAGASYGGFMINWMAGHIDQFKYPFRCFVSHDGTFDALSSYYSTEELWFEEWEYGGVPWKSELFEKWNPAKYAANFKVPMLVVHGEQDFRLPVTQGFMLFTALQRLGVESKMLYFPDEGHFVVKPQNARLWWQTVYDWIAQHIR